MNRQEWVRTAYALVGKLSGSYDGMMQGTSLAGRLALRFLWRFKEGEFGPFQSLAFRGIPEGFAGKLLDLPTGTGTLSLPVYQKLPHANVTCADYSPAMLEKARRLAEELSLSNVRFQQEDAGSLSFPDGSFDCIVSQDGLHAFPDKPAALTEMKRVLKDGGILTGACYIRGKNVITDLFIRLFCAPCGFFTPPFWTEEELRSLLATCFRQVDIKVISSFAGFVCWK